MEPISPCVSRNASRYVVRSVRHVSIAKSEYLHWPPRDVRRGVAGVGVSQPVRDALFPARRQAGEISTAVAIHNLGEEAMGVSCRLMQGGAVLEEVEIHLGANGQEARYIEELFPGTDTSDFVGSVRCTAPGQGMFTGIAVELDASNQIFTTLPVVSVPERMSQE